MFRRSRVISSSAPNGSSIRSSARRERERARDRDALLHAARELPRMVALEAGELDELEHLLDARRRASRGSSRASRAAARCSSRRCASRRARRAGRRSRSRGRAAPGAAVLPFTVDPARRRLDEVADDPQQRRLAAARRPDQRDELARLDRRGRSPASATVFPRANVFATPFSSTTRHATCSGARRTTSFSASTTARKKAIPSSAAMMFVAQSSCGSIE